MVGCNLLYRADALFHFRILFNNTGTVKHNYPCIAIVYQFLRIDEQEAVADRKYGYKNVFDLFQFFIDKYANRHF